MASRVVAVCGLSAPPKSTKLLLEGLELSLVADLQGEDLEPHTWGQPGQGQQAFAKLYATLSLTEGALNDATFLNSLGYPDPEALIASHFEAELLSRHPRDLLVELNAWRNHASSPMDGVTSTILYLSSHGDRLFTPKALEEEAKRLPPALRANWHTLKSVWGHRAGDARRPGQEADAVAIANAITRFMKK